MCVRSLVLPVPGPLAWISRWIYSVLSQLVYAAVTPAGDTPPCRWTLGQHRAASPRPLVQEPTGPATPHLVTLPSLSSLGWSDVLFLPFTRCFFRALKCRDLKIFLSSHFHSCRFPPGAATQNRSQSRGWTQMQSSGGPAPG